MKGKIMCRFHFLPFLFILVSLLPGCAGAKSPEEYRMQTDIPAAVELTATVQTEIVSRTPPQDCPITRPQDPPFAPPAPYSGLGTDGYFWYGTNDLWVSIPDHAVWSELPHDAHGYSQKIPWWRNGYEWDREPQPNLTVTGERLDAKAAPLKASRASNAYAEDMGSAMMVGVEIPTLGCWRITGRYGDAELSFVVWVAE